MNALMELYARLSRSRCSNLRLELRRGTRKDFEAYVHHSIYFERHCLTMPSLFSRAASNFLESVVLKPNASDTGISFLSSYSRDLTIQVYILASLFTLICHNCGLLGKGALREDHWAGYFRSLLLSAQQLYKGKCERERSA